MEPKLSNKEFAKKIEKRTRALAVASIKLSHQLPSTPEGRVVRNQVTKSGTSVGANYREANRARSRNDFFNKISIAESEGSETQYWLEIIVDVQWLSWVDVKPVYDECSEILALFTSIGKRKK